MVSITPVRLPGSIESHGRAWQPRPRKTRADADMRRKRPGPLLACVWNQWRSFLFPRSLLARICRQDGVCPIGSPRTASLRLVAAGELDLAFEIEDDRDRRRRSESEPDDM